MAATRRKKQSRRAKGEGSVYPIKRKGKLAGWQASLIIDGVERSRNAPTREAAEAKLAEMLELRRRKIDVGSSEQRLSDWCAYWLATIAPDLRETTLIDYRYQVETYILPALGEIRLCDLDAATIQRMLDTLIADIRTASKGKRQGTRTAEVVAQRLAAALEFAVLRKVLPESPMPGVKIRKDKPAPIVPPTAEQVAALLAASLAPLEGVRPTNRLGLMLALNDAVLFHAYALLGIRQSEGIGLRWTDVDLDAGTLWIREQVQYVEGALTPTPTKNERDRLLPVPAVLGDLLRRLRAAQAEVRLRRGDTWQDQDLVVTTRDGRPIWHRNVNRTWYELRAAAGMPETTKLHHLRHSVATLLDEAGASEAIKREVLGHSAGNVTQRYTHARVEAMRAKLEAVADRVTTRKAG